MVNKLVKMTLPAIDALNLIKNGPDLHGESGLFSFVEYFDNIFALNLPATLIPLTIITLKTKLKTKAREIIDMNPQCTTWDAIKTLLIANLSNFASSSTLIDELILLQNNSSTIEFLQKTQQQVVKIINKYRLDNPLATDQQIADNSATIRRIALKQFRDKLREPFRSILAVRNPDSMEAALTILRESSYNLDDGPKKQQNQHNQFHNNNHNFYRNNYNNFQKKFRSNSDQSNHRNNCNNFKNNFRNKSNDEFNYRDMNRNNYSVGNNFPSNYRSNNNDSFNRSGNNRGFNYNQNLNQSRFHNNQIQNRNSEMSRIRRFGIPQPMDCDQDQQQNFHFVASNDKDPPPQVYHTLR